MVRVEKAAFGVGPTNQSFDAHHVAAAQIELRLVEHGQVAVVDRVTQFAQEPNRRTAFGAFLS